ncbi:MAG: 3,4-dihydroxy-2-butanone-4-phosphate synthase [Methanomassiliicoccales archaeon]|nr:3,4-dihydroxy-2-butanone-4-phosphate synthase [Methanomassiliicoccales archaeon]
MSDEVILDAMKDICEGKMVFIFDSDNREKETDMTIASQFVTSASIREMRKNAGGLICTTVDNDICRKLDMPFLVDVLACNHRQHPVLELLSPNDIPYDTKSAFSITINHRKTFTGVTDNDRALTVSEFAKLAQETVSMSDEEARTEFGKRFRSPGHIHMLNSTPQLLSKRKGHTELATAMMVLAGVTPSATICEMMGDDGYALSKEKAKKYAKRFDLCFLEGKDIIEFWKRGGNGK